MRWYFNEESLQGQFATPAEVEALFLDIMTARSRSRGLHTNLRVCRRLGFRPAVREVMFRDLVAKHFDKNLRAVLLNWIDRTGPFVEDERTPEEDDYFECFKRDVTDGGLGEAARRSKGGEAAASFSLIGGDPDFALSPLQVIQGLAESPIAWWPIENLWSLIHLEARCEEEFIPATSWRELVEKARDKFVHLELPDSLYSNRLLAREPFDSVIRDRVFALLKHLNDYVDKRDVNGLDTAESRTFIEQFCSGERALFSGESISNQNEFRRELTFPHPLIADESIFAHWHGKISHRYFRMHFEWPVPSGEKCKIVYFGPKLTKQ